MLRVCLSGVICGLAFGACSAIVNFVDCKSDIDCAGAGEGFVCNANNKCVAGEAPGTSTAPETTSTSDPTTSTTSTTSDPTTTSGVLTDPSSSSIGGPLPCTKHSECVAAFDVDYICGKQGECVSALSPECTEFHWPGGVPSDKVVFLGSIMSTMPPFDALVLPLQNAVQLAVEDFNTTSELPGGYEIAWLACDDQAKPELAKQAASHLSDVVGAPAVVGPIFSELVLDLAGQVKSSGTLMISPSATARSITALVDDDLVWRTITSDVYQANALADRIPMLVPQPTKVALLFKDDAYGNPLLSDTLNRLTMTQPMLTTTTHKYPNPVGLTMDQLLQMYAPIVANAWDGPGKHPDTIVLIGTTEVTLLILSFMNAWAVENPDPPLPRFIVTHGGVPALPGLIDAAPDMASKQALMAITEGVAPIIFDAANFNNFNLRYKIRFNDQEPISAAALSYDAAMVVLLAMSGVPNGTPISGSSISDAIAKLVDKKGIPVSFGEVDTMLTFITKARNNLVAGKTLDLRGVSGELDFDLDTGEVRTNLLGWGLDPDANMPNKGVLDPKRTYILDPIQEDGTWMDLP